jgi:hypothetical protein
MEGHEEVPDAKANSYQKIDGTASCGSIKQNKTLLFLPPAPESDSDIPAVPEVESAVVARDPDQPRRHEVSATKSCFYYGSLFVPSSGTISSNH